MSSQPTPTNPSATPSTPPPPPGGDRGLSTASTNNYSITGSTLAIDSIDFSPTIPPAPNSFTLTSQFRRPQPPSRASSYSSSSSSSPSTSPSRHPSSNSAATTRARRDRVAEARPGSGGVERRREREVIGVAAAGTGRRQTTWDMGRDDVIERLGSDLARLALRARSPPRSTRATPDAAGGRGGGSMAETRRQPSIGEEEMESREGRRMTRRQQSSGEEERESREGRRMTRRQQSSGEEEMEGRDGRRMMRGGREEAMGVREEREGEGAGFPPARWGRIANRLLAQAQSAGRAAARAGAGVVEDVVAWGLEGGLGVGGGEARERRQQEGGGREGSRGKEKERDERTEESDTQDYVGVPILEDEEQEEHEALCGRVCPLRDRSGEGDGMDEEEWQVVLFR